MFIQVSEIRLDSCGVVVLQTASRSRSKCSHADKARCTGFRYIGKFAHTIKYISYTHKSTCSDTVCVSHTHTLAHTRTCTDATLCDDVCIRDRDAAADLPASRVACARYLSVGILAAIVR